MMYRVCVGEPRPGLPVSVALAAFAALWWLDLNSIAPALAEGELCAGCSIESRRARLDQVLADDPSRGRIEARLEDKPWIARDWASLPVAARPAGELLSIDASLEHLGSFGDSRIARRVEEAKALAPAALPRLPKPAPQGPVTLDVWSRVEASSSDADKAEARRGTVGADVRLARGTVVGVAAEIRDDAASPALVAATPSLQHDQRLAAYFAVKPGAAVTFDARAQWAESRPMHGLGLVTTQNALSARLRTDLRYAGFLLVPAVSVAHGIDEMAEAPAGGGLERSTLAVTPRLSRPFALSGGGKIEPFLSLKSQMDMATGLGGAESTHGVGGGLTIARPDAYSLSVTTDVEQAASADRASVKGRLELKLPLR
ncbi:MAG: hypothetical protein AB7O57_20410 [Hyphomicrobiaceae bacterium]